MYGGRNSAKSYFAAQKVLLDTLSKPYSKIILIRKKYRDIKDSQFADITRLIRDYQLQDLFHIIKSPLEITCTNGNSIIARGLDKPDNTKSISEPSGAWYEEASQIGYDHFTETTLTMRTSKTYIQEILTFNPHYEKIWINDHFFPDKQSYEKTDANFHFVKSRRKDTTILHTTYKDNIHRHKGVDEQLESLKEQDENYYKVFTLGLWGGALKGLIYPEYRIIKDSEFPENGDIVFGLDYGYNNPSAFIQVSYYDEEIYLKELLYQDKLTHAILAETIRDNFNDIIQGRTIVPDPSQLGLVEELQKYFYIEEADKSPGSVSQGIQYCKGFKINVTESSTNLINEFDGYIWKEKKAENETKDELPTDEPVKFNDHGMDAFRYAIWTYGRQYWTGNNDFNIRWV